MHSIFNLKHGAPKNIPIVFHNRSNYDYHSIIKELAEDFRKQCICLRKDIKRYITSTILIEKDVFRIDKNKEKVAKIYVYKKLQKNIPYMLQFIDSARFLARSLPNLVNNLSEEILKIKCKFGHDDKNVKLVESNISAVIKMFM